MSKPFDIWNENKKIVNKRAYTLGFNEREIWNCHLGINVGYEQDGKGDVSLRPVLIIKKFNNVVFWALPLSRTTNENQYLHILKNRNSKVILSQLRLIDAKRLKYRVGRISENESVLIKEKIKTLLT